MRDPAFDRIVWTLNSYVAEADKRKAEIDIGLKACIRQQQKLAEQLAAEREVEGELRAELSRIRHVDDGDLPW